jgi:hypothetical protein
MFIIDLSVNIKLPVTIERLADEDHKVITKKRFMFNWKQERTQIVYKLRIDGQTDILGLMSVEYFDTEERLEIRLLEVSKENVGAGKSLGRIAGILIAFAARLAVKKYGSLAAISLVPKTVLSQYYIEMYHFEPAGKSLFMEGQTLWNILNEYHYDR